MEQPCCRWLWDLCLWVVPVKCHVPATHLVLPDAMGGPTPRQRPHSCRNHGRGSVYFGSPYVSPLFIAYAPQVLELIGWVGAFTAFFAASIACVQTDIKRVLAFSTISQIGFMIVALGVCTDMNPHEGGLGYGIHVPPLHSRHVQGALVLGRR